MESGLGEGRGRRRGARDEVVPGARHARALGFRFAKHIEDIGPSAGWISYDRLICFWRVFCFWCVFCFSCVYSGDHCQGWRELVVLWDYLRFMRRM